MQGLKAVNLGIRFLLELAMLGAICYWGFKTHSSWALKILFGVGLPLLVAVLWGVFIAPKAMRPLGGATHLVLELTLLATGPVALFASARPGLGWAFAALLVLNKILLVVWKQ